jgi:hypothetical protein
VVVIIVALLLGLLQVHATKVSWPEGAVINAAGGIGFFVIIVTVRGSRRVVSSSPAVAA